MPKKLLTLLVICLIPLCALCAPAQLTKDDLTLYYSDAAYFLNTPAAPLITAIEGGMGEMELTQAESCLFDGKGMDKEFSNDVFIVGTYPSGEQGEDMVESLFILSDAVATARGAKVGMLKDDIIALYGEKYTIEYDTMVYALESGEALWFVLDLETDGVLYWALLNNTGL